MSTATETQSKRERSTLYIAVAVGIGVLMVIGLIFCSAEATREAEQKADELIARSRTPARRHLIATRSYGCSATTEARPVPTRTTHRVGRLPLSQLANGAAGPGLGP